MIEHSLFLSYSFEEKPKIIRYFENLLSNFGFNIYKHTYRESAILNNEIEKDIKSRDVFVAVITKNDNNTIKEWLISEITFASVYKKTNMLLFIEDGIISSVLNEIESIKIPFNKKTLHKDIINRSFVKSLYMFKEKLIGDIYFPLFEQEKLLYIVNIISKDLLEISSRVKVKSLSNSFQEIVHTSNSLNKTSDISIKENKFKFKCLQHPDDINLKGILKVNSKENIRLSILADDYIKKDNFIEYEYSFKRQNHKAFTQKEALKRNKSYYYEEVYKNTSYSRQNVSIEHPTKELIHKIKFPTNYKIKNYGIYVFVIKTSNRDIEEEQRIYKYLSLIDDINNLSLSLHIKYPKLNRNYHIYWTPKE